MSVVQSICVYCGASSRVDETYKTVAHDFGAELGRRRLQMVYGGGRVGLMGICADAALAAGGRVVGIIPQHLQSLEVGHGGLTEFHVVDSMHSRKRMMVDRSDAFAVLPGGLGTLDETFEILTWRQLRLHDKPVVLVNVGGYWDPLLALVDHMIAAGFAQPGHRGLFAVADGVEAAFEALSRAPGESVPPETKWM
ncbi:TIGR00730 family Rossman fold protein [Arenibaculum sp.]|uniref:LOG family protein n=1 Tax=Arenibaculum sp. TaxID=2865862 RepID=UPI002E12F176|nr:TIGR00730 family Rossman fold protein [Arenibaculum sp.]